MIHILYEQVSETKARVYRKHFMPFDSVYGLLPEELNEGLLVEQLPSEPDYVPVGKDAVLYVNPQTGELWYELEDRPLTPQEIQKEQNEKLDLIMMALLEQEGII